MTAIERAIACTGGITKLALRLDVSYQVIQKWRKRGFVPYARAAQIEKITGGRVRRHELFPVLFDGYTPANRRRKPAKTPESTP